MLQAMHSCSKDDQKSLVKIAKPQLIHALCDCIVNVVHGRVPINNSQKNKLKKKIKVLKVLTNRKTPTVRKKKLLMQHGAGIFSAILGPVLKTIAGAVLGA